jgi:NADH dehydrogenase
MKGRRFSGFLAWWMWRTVYWSKLPSVERRIRVAVDWTLDLFFPPDTVQLGSGRIPHEELDHEGPEHDPAHSHHGELTVISR